MSKFGLASLSLVGEHALEDDDEECEWLFVTFARRIRDVARQDSNALLLSLARVARSRGDNCLRAGISVGNLFRAKFCDALLGGGETLISKVTHGVAQFGHGKQLCVAAL